MIYKAIVGSRTYGLSADQSDVDLAVVSGTLLDKDAFRKEGYDMFQWTPEQLVALQEGPRRSWTDFSRLFPHEFCIENDLSKWIVDNREEVIKAILPDVYEAYMRISADFCQRSTVLNKRTMMAIHFRNMLANYAEGMTFAEALRPQGAYRDFLLSIRNGKVSISRAQAANANARERAKAAAGFYAAPRADASILEEFRHMVYREVDLLK